MRISDWSSDVCSSDLGKAAAFPELFYGQLSLEQLGRPVPRPRPVTAIPISPGERTAFYAKDLVQAIRLLGQMGNRDDQTGFLRALSEQAAHDRERALASQLARQTARPPPSDLPSRAPPN